MVVIGIGMEQSGLADTASRLLIGSVDGLSPLAVLCLLYLITMVTTELLSHATVAVLMTPIAVRSEEHTYELQSLMRISYAVFCLKKKTNQPHQDDDDVHDIQYTVITDKER